MTPSSLLAEIVHKPAVAATLGVMVLALVATLVLSVMIKRRRVAAVPAKPTEARIESTRIQRATGALLPDDMHQRLRYLTADLDAALPDHSEPPAAPQPYGVPRAAVARPSVPDDTTQHFGSSEGDLFDRTTRFDDGVDGVDDDATRFFGSDLSDLEEEPAAASAQSEPAVAQHEPAVAEPEVGTAFFGLDDDLPAPAGTQLFSPQELELTTGAPAGTQLFSPQELDLAPEAESGTHFFGPDELDAPASHAAHIEMDGEPAETRFFGDLDDDLAGDELGGTGMLRALPPMTPGAAQPAAQPASASASPARPAADAVFEPAALSDAALEKPTGPLPALPPSQQPVSHATLEVVREKLASVDTPHVLALSVIDGAGRVLAGETDEDLTGELRSLMAESGQGNAADVDQPVRLGDESDGALLLLPTGANALLGALMREDGDADGTRSRLRGLAQDIGETMRRAS